MKEHNEEKKVADEALGEAPAAEGSLQLEEIHLTGEKIPVEYDDKRVSDEYTDYKYLSMKKRGINVVESHYSSHPEDDTSDYIYRHEHHHHHHRSEGESDGSSEDTVAVASDHSSEHSHHHHHHHHHHHSEGETGDSSEQQEVVASDRSSSHSHHHHHHHSGSSSGHSHHHHHHHHHHHRHHRRMKKWKKVLLIVLCSLLALIIALGGVFLILRITGQGELFDTNLNVVVPTDLKADVQDDGDYIVYNGQTYRYNKDITSMLFLGIDKRSLDEDNEENTGGQADVVVMMALNMKDHKLSMIAVPRDTMTQVAMYTPSGHYNGLAEMQVCLAYAYGDGKESSCENIVSSVRRIFYNVPIKTFFALDLDGIAAVNDSVGGVDVVSPETISEFVKGEQYHLMGKSAENFVRERDKERVDSSMMRLDRQKIYAKSFMAKMMSSIKKNPATAVSVFNDSAPYSVTNMTAAKVSYLASELALGGSMETDMMTVPGKISLDKETQLARYDIDNTQFFEQFLSIYYEKV